MGKVPSLAALSGWNLSWGPTMPWWIAWLSLLSLICIAAAGAEPPSSKPKVAWTGRGSIRLLVQVPPRDLGERDRDEMPAEIPLDFSQLLRGRSETHRADLATVQVIRYDAQTGLPIEDGNYGHGRDASERPFRWYDGSIPYDFPEAMNAVSRTDGKIVRRPRVRGGYFFNVLGEWQRGRLVWMHTQVDKQPSFYAIYFDPLRKSKFPSQLPPRAWVGDGTPRCDKQGRSTMAADHCRVDLDDWNDDGLVDLIVGEHYGHVFWWPNLGTKSEPIFRYAKFVTEADKPLDAGLAAAPKVVDWNGDGVKDLLVGTHWNRLLYFQNEGSNRDRRLIYKGVVEVEGRPLEVPIRPLERGSPDVFKRDYYPVPEVADWDQDGDLDLLLGGYVTGRVFFYENQGPREDGTPRLRLRGPLSADGKPLNVNHWCAAPCLADLDADGDLDLLSGNMPMYLKPQERAKHQRTFL